MCTRGIPLAPVQAIVSSTWTTVPEIREFLIWRRAKITPQRAGLLDVGIRRVPALRRGEVAALAGVRSSITPSWNAEPSPESGLRARPGRPSLSSTTPNLLNPDPVLRRARLARRTCAGPGRFDDTMELIEQQDHDFHVTDRTH
jgi:hypothetical protein